VRLLKLERVLAATDFDPSSDAALESAASLAAAAGARLHIAHVVPADQTDGGDAESSDSKAQMADTLRRVGVSAERQRIHIVTGPPEVALSDLAAAILSDVTVLGRHRKRPDLSPDAGIGNTAYAIASRALTPCLITSRRLNLPMRRIVVAIDTSETARGALLVALSWSSALRSPAAKDDPTLTALHVETGQSLSPDDAHMKRTIDHELDILRRSAGSWAGVSVEGATEADTDPVTAIAKYAKDCDADLVVLGTRGLSMDNASRLGSVSAAVTRQLEVPVLLVPPAVWRNYARDIDYF